MKKVLSFVLAVVMVLSLSTVAFAWTSADAVIPMDGATADAKLTAVTGEVLTMVANGGEGEKFTIGVSTGDYAAKDFAISAKVKKGADVVKATVKGADKTVTIQAIPDWTWGINDYEEFEVVVTVRPASKATKDHGDKELTVKGFVVLNDDNRNSLLNNTTGGTVVDVKDADNKDVVYEVVSGKTFKVSEKLDGLTLTFEDMDDISMVFGKVFDQGNTVVVFNDKHANHKAIQKSNLDASLTYYNFVNAPEFDVAGKVIIDVDEDQFIYEIVDGKVVASKFAWDEEEWAWVLKTNVLGSYVVSSKELPVAAASDVVANPSTGASDMVNVAVAMAVVSIAAAGAVALKK